MASESTIYGSTVLPMATTALNYGRAVCAGIAADQFGRRPQNIECNTPAWVIGHLSIYPDKALGLIGRGDLAQTDERYETLFAAGTPSPDDPDGTYYPAMEELLDRFVSRTELILRELPGVEESVFRAENPAEGRFREMFPSIGSAVGFLLCGHTMMHLGQVSTWRRCMGLGSAM